MKKVLLATLLILAAFISCNKDEDEPVEPGPTTPAPVSPVVFDPAQVPYTQLSQYNFFQGDMAELDPVHGVLPYDVISPLFTDYAKKQRFIWMAAGVKAAYNGDGVPLQFQDNTVLIKNFYYDHVQPGDVRRIIETRLIFRTLGEWHFATYVWNEAQTEATLDMSGSFTPVTWNDTEGDPHSITYRIPSDAECLTCHKENGIPTVIGPKPQNLNADYPYSDGTMNQLAKWEQFGYLEPGTPADILTTVKWDDPTQDLTERVRSYLDMNCAHCHSEHRHCDYRPMRFAFNQTADPVNLGVCVHQHEQLDESLTHIVARGSPARSVLFYRISSTDETVRMPLLGRTIVHQEAVDMIQEWIESLDPPCE
jgi:uncharacterized repeat protein (TIGR03806 family)